jgi:hypothetical protein
MMLSSAPRCCCGSLFTCTCLSFCPGLLVNFLLWFWWSWTPRRELLTPHQRKANTKLTFLLKLIKFSLKDQKTHFWLFTIASKRLKDITSIRKALNGKVRTHNDVPFRVRELREVIKVDCGFSPRLPAPEIRDLLQLISIIPIRVGSHNHDIDIIKHIINNEAMKWSKNPPEGATKSIPSKRLCSRDMRPMEDCSSPPRCRLSHQNIWYHGPNWHFPIWHTLFSWVRGCILFPYSFTHSLLLFACASDNP